MGTAERDIINDILLNLPENERLFRSNSGMAWAGKAVKKGEIIIIKNARPFHGMPEGFPDLCGWTEIEVTPEMVGRRVAVFTAVEVKTGKQTLRKEQRRFKEIIERMGGIWRTIKPSAP